jgi:hypothetical protein
MSEYEKQLESRIDELEKELHITKMKLDAEKAHKNHSLTVSFSERTSKELINQLDNLDIVGRDGFGIDPFDGMWYDYFVYSEESSTWYAQNVETGLEEYVYENPKDVALNLYKIIETYGEKEWIVKVTMTCCTEKD